MKQVIVLLLVSHAFLCSTAQTADQLAGSYMKIDSTSSQYQENGKWIADIDTSLLVLNKDFSFSFKWSPVFGPSSRSHLLTTGTWKIHDGRVRLNSKYQTDEYRFFESYKPEYGDSMVKVYVQTYDSLTGFLQTMSIGVIKDSTRESEMIFIDRDYPYNACSAVFKLSRVDKIVLFGGNGRMPPITPKDKRSNHFLLQYNLSTEWDYQYFKDFDVVVKAGKAIMGESDVEKIVLVKIK